MVSSPSHVKIGKSEVSRSILEEMRPKQAVRSDLFGGEVVVGASKSLEGRGVVKVEWKM